jgi:hypothetical protein
MTKFGVLAGAMLIFAVQGESVPGFAARTAAQSAPSSGQWVLVADAQAGVWRMNTNTGTLQYCGRPSGTQTKCDAAITAGNSN